MLYPLWIDSQSFLNDLRALLLARLRLRVSKLTRSKAKVHLKMPRGSMSFEKSEARKPGTVKNWRGLLFLHNITREQQGRKINMQLQLMPQREGNRQSALARWQCSLYWSWLREWPRYAVDSCYRQKKLIDAAWSIRKVPQRSTRGKQNLMFP